MMADSRVYPGTSETMDLGYSSVGYRGAAASSISNAEMEAQRNRMTLEEARWIGVRKKVPGMSGIPKKARSQGGNQNGSTFYVETEDPYQKKLKDLTIFVRNHFRQKECASFVPKPGQTKGQKAVKKIRDLKCHCGEVLMEHAGMQGPFPHFSSADMMLEYLVPKELHKLMSRERRHNQPPENIPEIPWKKESIRTTASCAFGKINFENVEHSGGKKPAKYIRMTDEDSVDNLIELMKDHWKIMEPECPNLVISVVGGAKNFKLDGRMRDTFAAGLIKAAKTTSAWLISSGFNMGVMKAVGQAVRMGQSFCWDNDRMVHVLRCIGIAPWGYVKNRHVLESVDGQGKFNANYRTSNVILHDSAVPLNPDHTHFIFVDDGYRIRYGGVSGIRAKLEQKISQSQTEGGLGIPVVLVVVEGGTDCINDARKSIEHKIPVVVCAGTGRAADILAYAYTHTKTSSGGVRSMKEKHELKLMDKIFDAYGEKWKEEEIEEKTNAIKESVQICCQNPDLLTVFHMNKHEDLDLSILSVLLKAKKGADEEQRLSQLKLALTWDRVDIAQEEIFREDVLWSTGSLDDVLTEALRTNKVKFVQLILQQGVVMKEYLTVQVLKKLYEEVPRHNYLYKVLHKLTGKEHLTLENISILLKRLLDRYDTFEETLEEVTDENGPIVKDINLRRFKRPYKMLLVWAILLKRQTLAKLFWELGEEPVTSALAATRIYHALAKNLPRHESHLKESFDECENEFEKLATNVLNECHHKDPDKAMMIAERKSPSWNEMTCLQIAAAATDQVFLSSVTCFSSMNVIWKHGILFSWFKMILALFFPPYIAFGLEILSLGENKLTWIQKMGVFYSSPMAKFAYGMIMYTVFLVLHSYMVLVDFQPKEVRPLEIIMIIWVFSFFVDEVHTFLAFPSPTIKSKIRDWYGFLKWLDLANFIVAFMAFIIHLFPEHYQVTKVFYCINSIIFFLRIMKIYVTNGQLGPKIFMIQRMLDELRMFVMVLFVFLLAYGVASQGLLYDIRTPSWTILKDVVYFPYWQLYGEIFLEEIDGDNCADGMADCKTGHWLIKFLLAAYLLVGNILLLNLLIAIFSHVFDKVEKNANEIWKYQMYFLVMEYEKKTALVPPFSLFEHVFLILQWIVRKTCRKRVKDNQNFGKRHLEYLQLFEKEMMMNFLRQMKAEEMSGIEMTVNKLQKRVDELTKLIEDEVIADQQPQMTTAATFQNLQDLMESRDAKSRWPPTGPVIRSGEDKAKLETVEEAEEEGKKKKKKKHKKEKKRKDKERGEIDEKVDESKGEDFETKLNNINLPPNIQGGGEKPEPPEKLFDKYQKDSEHEVMQAFVGLDDSGTDNMPSPHPARKVAGLNNDTETQDKLASKPKASIHWSPRRYLEVQDLSDDENVLTTNIGLKKRLTQERMQRYVSSDSEDDEGVSRRFSSKLKKQKKKSRYGSDTE